MRNALLMLATVATLLLAGTSHAKDKDSKTGQVDPVMAEAIEHFQNGVEFFEKENFEAAVAEFLKSHELVPAWELRYNIGICFEELGRPAKALHWLTTYLEKGGGEVPQERLYEVQSLIEELVDKVGYIELTVTPDDATVLMDGKAAGWISGKPLHADPGVRKIVVLKDGFTTFETSVTLASGDVEKLDVELSKAVTEASVQEDATPPEPPEPPVPAKPEHDPGITLSWTGLAIGGGTAAALAVAAGITGGLVLARRDDMLDAAALCEATTSRDTCPAAYDLQQRASSLKIATNVLWAMAGAALVTGVILLVTGAPKMRKEEEPVDEGLDSMGFSLTPLLAPGQAGLLGIEMGLIF